MFRLILEDSNLLPNLQAFTKQNNFYAFNLISSWTQLPDQWCHWDSMKKIEAHPLAVVSLLNQCIFWNQSLNSYSSRSKTKNSEMSTRKGMNDWNYKEMRWQPIIFPNLPQMGTQFLLPLQHQTDITRRKPSARGRSIIKM